MFTIGQHVAASNSRQITGSHNAASRKVMEIAKVIPNYEYRRGMFTTGYKLRTVGSNGKGGQVIWAESALEAI